MDPSLVHGRQMSIRSMPPCGTTDAEAGMLLHPELEPYQQTCSTTQTPEIIRSETKKTVLGLHTCRDWLEEDPSIAGRILELGCTGLYPAVTPYRNTFIFCCVDMGWTGSSGVNWLYAEVHQGR